jgi:hypothetical protein
MILERVCELVTELSWDTPGVRLAIKIAATLSDGGIGGHKWQVQHGLTCFENMTCVHARRSVARRLKHLGTFRVFGV